MSTTDERRMRYASLIANTQTMIDHDMRFSRTDVDRVLWALIVTERELAAAQTIITAIQDVAKRAREGSVGGEGKHHAGYWEALGYVADELEDALEAGITS